MDGKETVLKKFDAHGDKLTHWKIYYGYDAKGGQLADTTETHKGDLDAALSRKKLVEALNLLPPDDYLIQFKSAPTATNNIVSHRFQIGHVYNTVQQNGDSPIIKGYVSPETVELRIANALLTRDLQDIRKEIREAKNNEGNGTLKELIAGFKEILPVIKGWNTGQPVLEPRPVVVRGPKSEEEAARVSEAQERRAYFLKLSNEATAGLYDANDFDDVKPAEHGILLLWCMNEFRKSNPEMFNTLKPQLLAFADKLNEEEE